jgi:ABC-2 type transport system permease protein
MKSRIFPIIRKEFIHIIRDPRSLYLAIFLPIILLILFGYAITFDIKNIPIGIIEQDNSFLSRDLISKIRSSEFFHISFISKQYINLEKSLAEGKVKLILIIPDHFSRNIFKGNNAFLQILVDGSDNNTALIALGYISKIINYFSFYLSKEILNKEGNVFFKEFPLIKIQERFWYNPGLKSPYFIVPGLIAVVMMVLTVMLTSLTIAREWETGTMEQLIITPTKPIEIIIGKLIPYFLLGMLQLSLIILVGILLFKVPLKGNVFFLFIVSGIFLITGLGIGLFISTVTKSQQLAFMFSIIFTLLPSFLLSGFIFPISSMPKIIQLITYLVPARYFLTILRGIFLKGIGFYFLWQEILILIAFGIIIIFACAKRLRLSLE